MPALSDTVMFWLSDRKLHLCSLPTIGLWMRMLYLMHTSERPGFLQVNGAPMSAEELGRLANCSADEVSCCLTELLSLGIACVTDAGPVYCRLLVAAEQKDAERRRTLSVAGKKGALTKAAGRVGQAQAKPTLGLPLAYPEGATDLRENAGLSRAPPADTRITELVPVLSLSSLSSSDEEKKEYQTTPGGGAGGGRKKREPVPLPPIPTALDTPRFREAWAGWLQYHQERRTTIRCSTAIAQFRRLEAWGEAAAVQAIDNSICNGWTGLFFPKSDGPNLFSGIKQFLAAGDAPPGGPLP